MKILKAGKELREYKRTHTPAKCPLCGRLMKYVEARNITVDHDHKTGKIRGILCRNCNGLEGRINNLCTRAGTQIENSLFLIRILEYWEDYKLKRDKIDVYYPGCKERNGVIVPPKKKRKKRRKG